MVSERQQVMKMKSRYIFASLLLLLLFSPFVCNSNRQCVGLERNQADDELNFGQIAPLCER